MEKEITRWKWKSTIIDFNTISSELADYGDYLTKKDMVFHYLGTPDDNIHKWYDGGFSSEYNSALTYAKQLGLVEDYIDYESTIYDLQTQLKKQKEINKKAIDFINTPWSFESGNEKVDEIIHQKKTELIKLLKDTEETDINVGEVQ